ncbi:hypothetical protein AVEN_76056-1 [Araneus ventricosus]|uniref:Uncharacterized protein n=1 Tax=Araneus ventricosus TaxID=182803 RepID=A0A4Y2CSV4_ARAVE|nr:hypothetical protein AVEN_248235-1 [Araneus ventricosus]GBM06768.1 hypothetical protein AVEN_76056-1 [Araneus ventricosus]
MDFIEIGQQFNDFGVRNKWRFEWLKEKDQNELSFSEGCKKINEVGHCFCFICPKKINYGNNGKKSLKKHADDKIHQRIFRGLQCASLYPGSKQVSENATLSLNDRRANQKAVLACFVAENSLQFSLMPKLVELCQTLDTCRDKFVESLQTCSASLLQTKIAIWVIGTS